MKLAVKKAQASTLPKSAKLCAKLVLQALDRFNYRDGKQLEVIDPLSNGMIKIQKKENGRVHFRAPRSSEKSIRLRPSKGLLLLKDNVNVLQGFLEENPMILAFLDENQLRAVRR